jgi:hypothetical protein
MAEQIQQVASGVAGIDLKVRIVGHCVEPTADSGLVLSDRGFEMFDYDPTGQQGCLE